MERRTPLCWVAIERRPKGGGGRVGRNVAADHGPICVYLTSAIGLRPAVQAVPRRNSSVTGGQSRAWAS